MSFTKLPKWGPFTASCSTKFLYILRVLFFYESRIRGRKRGGDREKKEKKRKKEREDFL